MRILLYKKNHLVQSSGGAEKIMVWYANELVEKGHSVVLATRDNKKGVPFFKLDERVVFKRFEFSFSLVRRCLGKIFAKCGVIKYFPFFDREFWVSQMLNDYCDRENIDAVVVCGGQELIDFTAYGERKFPVILMLHSHPKAYFNKKRDKLYRRYLNNADAVQVLLPSFVSAVPDNYRGRIVCIGNPVLKGDVVFSDNKVIIYVARVDSGKQHHLLIEAFHLIASKFPEWQVHFYGMENKKWLEKNLLLIKQYHLENQVFFKGVIDNVSEKLKNAAFTAFPSAFEGFSLALTEAMAHGLPAIGFSSCTGVNELIKDGKNGFLVKDVAEFAEKMELLMTDVALRRKLGEQACLVTENYAVSHIIDQWVRLIFEMVKNKQNVV